MLARRAFHWLQGDGAAPDHPRWTAAPALLASLAAAQAALLPAGAQGMAAVHTVWAGWPALEPPACGCWDPNSCCPRCMPAVLPAPPSPPLTPAHLHAGPALAEEAALVEPVAAVATVQAGPVADVMTAPPVAEQLAAPAPAAEPVAVVAAAPPATEQQPAAPAPAAPAQEVAAVVAVAEAAPVAVVAAAPPSLDEAELLMAAERQSRAMDIVSAALSQADQLLAAEQLAAPIDISSAAAAEAESQPTSVANVAAAVGPDEAAVQADIVEIEAEEKELEAALAAIVADEPPAVAAALVAELQVRRRGSGRAWGA